MKLFAALIASFPLLYPIWVVHRQTLGKNEKIERTPAEWGVEYEDIEYKTSDGLLLKGWWVAADSQRAVLLLHGNGGSRNGFHSGIFELGRWYREQNFNVMMVDLRAHGESEGKRVYFGVKEHEDMLGWLREVDSKRRFSWYLHGFSMGASTALMMKEKKPTDFAKIVLDAPWIDFHALARQELWRRAYLPSIFYGYVSFLAKSLFGIDFKIADNKKRCETLCREKILYIFERGDRLLGETHSSILSKLCPEAKISLLEGEHVGAFKHEPKTYTSILAHFLDANTT